MSVWLVRNAVEAAQALNQFAGYLKLASWLYLRRFALPTLPGVIVSSWDPDAEKGVSEFANSAGVDRLLLRSDRERETGDYPRGGYVVDLQDVGLEAQRFLAMERLPYFLPPQSPFSDVYSLSVGLWGDEAIVEVVGPGFDASDLKRGDASPHESFSIRFERGAFGPTKTHEVVSVEEYRLGWNHRLLKIGRLMAGNRRISNSFLHQLARDALLERQETLLLEHEGGYAPIPEERLGQALSDFELLHYNLGLGGLPQNPLVLSTSFVESEEAPIHWDFIWPGKKYVVAQG